MFRKAGASADRLKTAVVGLRSDGANLCIQFRCDALAVEYRLADPQPAVDFVVPFAFLADCEGGKDEPVCIRTDGNEAVVAEWTNGGVSQRCRYPAIKGEAVWFEPPSTMSPNDNPSLLASLTEVLESASHDRTRYAVDCIQLRGQKGEAVGTDGHQLLVVRGLQFPWKDDILIRRTGVFSCKEFAAAETLELGRSDTHCVFRAAPWSVWLPIEKDLRYPKVDQIIPRDFTATTLALGRADADFLTRTLPRLPRLPELDDHSPVTLHLNGHVVVRAKGETGPATELILNDSRTEGDEVQINTNRHHLQRAVQLGLLDLQIRQPNTPIVAADATRTFVWVPLDPKRALGPSADALRIESSPSPNTEPASHQPIERNPPVMNRLNSQPQDHPRETDTETVEETVVDPLQEAEAIKAQLRELLGRTGELVTAIKRQRRQAQLVRSTLASLKQLQEVA